MGTKKEGTAVAPAKRVFKITAEDLEKFWNEDAFQKGRCCGFVEYDGVDAIKSTEDAVLIRRAASGESGVLDDDYEILSGDGEEWGTNGVVFVTTIPSQNAKHKFLLAAGFKPIHTFKGNTSNMITLWVAQTLQPGRFHNKKEEYEEVTL